MRQYEVHPDCRATHRSRHAWKSDGQHREALRRRGLLEARLITSNDGGAPQSAPDLTDRHMWRGLFRTARIAPAPTDLVVQH